MKDWFTQFNKCDLNNLKVVFVTESYYNNDTIMNDLRFTSNFSSKFFDTASEQGIFFLTLNRTSNDNIPNSHAAHWFSFNKELIEFICNVNKNTVFVFIGDNTKTFAQYVNPIDSYMIFLNDLDDEIWSNELINSDEPNKSIIKEHINFMLKKHGKLEINW
jgi:uracil DNA glycosylase